MTRKVSTEKYKHENIEKIGSHWKTLFASFGAVYENQSSLPIDSQVLRGHRASNVIVVSEAFLSTSIIELLEDTIMSSNTNEPVGTKDCKFFIDFENNCITAINIKYPEVVMRARYIDDSHTIRFSIWTTIREYDIGDNTTFEIFKNYEDINPSDIPEGFNNVSVFTLAESPDHEKLSVTNLETYGEVINTEGQATFKSVDLRALEKQLDQLLQTRNRMALQEGFPPYILSSDED